MSSIFDRYYKKYDAWYDRNKFAYLSELKALKKVIPKNGEGLEIGVGTARFAAPLGIQFGIDPSRKMLKIARQRGISVCLGRGEQLPFKGSSFDYVAIIITLCFVKEPRKVIDEAKRVLKKRGKIIIGIVNKNSFLGRFYRRKKSVFYKKANFFSVKEIANLLKKTGFDKITYYQTLFKSPHSLRSIEKPLRGFNKGGFVVISGRKVKL